MRNNGNLWARAINGNSKIDIKLLFIITIVFQSKQKNLIYFINIFGTCHSCNLSSKTGIAISLNALFILKLIIEGIFLLY